VVLKEGSGRVELWSSEFDGEYVLGKKEKGRVLYHR